MDAISFKVTSQGVYINLNPEKEFFDIQKALLKHSNEASNFFAGVDLYINLNGLNLLMDEMQELIELVSRYEKVENVYFISQEVSLKSRNMDTILINRTIRSGQLIKYPANIVIIGDVNPGAEVIAGGDILVVGKLRGVVHAGATGANDSQIIALKLQPTQLRIANIISRSPDELKNVEPNAPERAYVKNGTIIVEELEQK
ncbi:septum site-determining protein MinC [Natronospora cellulosivora (SeqCode)]